MNTIRKKDVLHSLQNLLLIALLTGHALLGSASAFATIDSDGDHIADIFDLDDDNDGIRDDQEGTRQVIVNGDFEDYDLSNPVRIFSITGFSTNAYYLNADDVPGWIFSVPNHEPNYIEIWDSGHNQVPSLSGDAHAEVRSNRSDGVLYQSFETRPGEIIHWSLWHRGRLGDDTTVLMLGESLNSIDFQQVMTSGNAAWEQFSGSYTVPNGQTETVLALKSTAAEGDLGSYGSFVDRVEVYIDTDTDGDGVPNRLDLDSDNDGLSDLIESGQSPVIDTDINGVRDDMQASNTADQNGDGLADFNGNIGQIPVNTDADSEPDTQLLPDFLDLDADNDTVPDAVETQGTFGYISPVIIDNATHRGVNQSGLFNPVDSDADGVFDVIDSDSDNDNLSDRNEAGFTATGVSYSDPDGDITNPATQLANVQLPSTREIDFRENPDTDGDGNPNPDDPNPNSAVAVNDNLNAPLGRSSRVNILANDDFLANNDPNNLGTTSLQDTGVGTASGTINLNPETGELTYTPLAAELNTTVTIIYRVCSDASGGNICDTAAVSINVTEDTDDTDGDGNPDPTDPNPSVPVANDDGLTARVGQESVVNVLANDDFLANNNANNLGTTSLTVIGGSAQGAIDLSAQSGELRYTPVAAEADSVVTIIYQACNNASGVAVCDSAIVSISVINGGNNDPDGDGNPNPNDPNPNSPVANNDSVNAIVGENTRVNVLANDDFLPNNDGMNLGTTSLRDNGTGTAQGTVIFDADTGELIYTALPSELDTTVTVVYEVCNNASGAAVCANATVSIEVTNDGNNDPDGDGNPDPDDPNPSVPVANDDSLVAPTGETSVINVLANDDFLANNAATNLGTTSLTMVGGSAAGIVEFSAATGELRYIPLTTEANQLVTVAYQVCNNASGVDVCDTAIVSILVTDGSDPDGDGNPDPNDPNPNTPVATADTLTAVIEEPTVVDILANDDFLPNNDPLNRGTTTLRNSGLGTAMGSVSFDAGTGELTYTPLITELGTPVTVVYEVCNDASGVDVCATASVTINVIEGDRDGDGIPDSEELGPDLSMPRDSDSDGTPDYRDLDSDGDGILDIIEAGMNPTAPTDSDGDTIPDYLDPDSDNDGILDIIEDTRSPKLTGMDEDGDGVDDAVDPDQTGGSDGPPMNGVDDALEPADTDGDGIPNHLDLDSDGDRILDILEAPTVPLSNTDSDGDLIDDALDVDITQGSDVNNNGIDDALEPADADSDGKPNYLDLDADNDSIPDAVEAAPDGSTGLPTLSDIDSNGNGIDDNVDATLVSGDDSNGNDIIDSAEPVNTDLDTGPAGSGDPIPDYLDLDSDNDSLLDLEEARNAPPEIDDVNADGLVDSVADEASTPSPADSDGDGVTDFRDVESDNPDNDGTGPRDIDSNNDVDDTDNDGRVDDPTDDDGDGIGNEADKDDTVFGSGPRDTDGDLIPNTIDLDDDNDTIPDLVEGFNPADPAASVDTDGDLVPDYLDVDSDNDGLSDLIEGPAYNIDDIDTNADGLLDYDSDNNGVIDPAMFQDTSPVDGLDDDLATLSPVDTDGDGIPDFRDVDADGDAAATGLAVLKDAGESIANVTPAQIKALDDDNNGALDDIDPRTGQPLNPLTLVDINGNGIPEFREALTTTGGGASAGSGGAAGGDGLRTATNGAGSIGSLAIAGSTDSGGHKKRATIKPATTLATLTLVLSGMSLPAHAVKYQTGCGYHIKPIDDDTYMRVIDDDDANSESDGEFASCWYLGGGLGLSFLDPEGRDSNGFASKDDGTTDFGWDVLIGYHWFEHWFGEFKYTDLGEADLESNLSSDTAAIDYEALSLMAGYYFFDNDEPLNLYVKAGLSKLLTDAKQGAIRREVTSTQFAFGAGLQYRINASRWFTRLDIDFYDRDAAYANLSLNAYLGGRKLSEPQPPAEPPPPPPVVVLTPEEEEDCKSFDSVIDDVNFAVDSAELNEIAIAALLHYARALQKYPETIVMVSAHTDWDGSEQYNLELSARRAVSVMRFLINSGVASSQLTSKGFGESQPIADNNTVAGRAINRRVELSILESKTCY